MAVSGDETDILSVCYSPPVTANESSMPSEILHRRILWANDLSEN